MATKKKVVGSFTAPNQPKRPRGKGKPFQPNNPETGEVDPRINRGGRKAGEGFNALRKLALEISQEVAFDRKGQPILAPNGTPMSIAEVVLRLLAADPNKRDKFLEISHGKPADVAANIDLSRLTDEQLKRVADGEDIVHVLITSQSASNLGAEGTTGTQQDTDSA